jgi:hypothetical protein
MKESPYLNRAHRFPKGSFEWKPRNLLLYTGGNFYVNSSVILEVERHRIIWLSRDSDGFARLNLDIRDANGDILFKMKDNDWLIHTPFEDLECPPSVNRLHLSEKSYGVEISIKFCRTRKSQACQKVVAILGKGLSPKSVAESVTTRRVRLELEKRMKEDSITMATLEGHLVWPIDIVLKRNYTRSGRMAIPERNGVFFDSGLAIGKNYSCFTYKGRLIYPPSFSVEYAASHATSRNPSKRS